MVPPPGSALTPADISDLVAYAKGPPHHRPARAEAFGHLHPVLEFDRYSDLAETPHGMCLRRDSWERFR